MGTSSGEDLRVAKSRYHSRQLSDFPGVMLDTADIIIMYWSLPDLSDVDLWIDPK